jgi:hypothetical protein
MHHFSRRELLKTSAGILAMLGGLRRLIGPPLEAARQEPTIKGVGELWRDDAPYDTNASMRKLQVLRGSNREGMTTQCYAEFMRAVLKDRTLS